MTDLTKLDETCARLREELQKATKYTWDDIYLDGVRVITPSGDLENNYTNSFNDCVLILDAHNSLPFLLDAIEELKKRVEAGERLMEIVKKEQKEESRRIGQIIEAFKKSPWSPQYISPMEAVIDDMSKSHQKRTEALATYEQALKA